jgi:hypothetical protein
MKNNKGIFIRLSDDDRKIIDVLKNIYSINISQFFRNFIREKYSELNKNDNKK